MTEYKNILLATDFSEDANRAFQHALDLCRRSRARLHLFHVPHSPYRYCRHVVDEHVPAGSAGGEAYYDEKIEKAALAALKREYGAKLGDLSDTSFAVRCGAPGVEIIRYATKNDIDVIVMGALGKAREDHADHEGTVATVARYASCDVVVIPTQPG